MLGCLSVHLSPPRHFFLSLSLPLWVCFGCYNSTSTDSIPARGHGPNDDNFLGGSRVVVVGVFFFFPLVDLMMPHLLRCLHLKPHLQSGWFHPHQSPTTGRASFFLWWDLLTDLSLSLIWGEIIIALMERGFICSFLHARQPFLPILFNALKGMNTYTWH